MTAIETTALGKSFVVRKRSGDGVLGRIRREAVRVEAVRDVTLTVGEGEVIGYIGPNGAGKSTTVKMLTGILVPTSGTVRVAGLEPVRRRVDLARRIGVVFGQRTQLWWDLPLRDSFDLLRHIYRVPADRARANLDRFCDVLGLDEFLHTPVRQLSLGQRMRGDLAAALLHDPEIVFLDEPTIGLDIVAKAKIREFLVTLNRDHGTTIMLTTHDLSDIEHLCERMLILDRGTLIYDGPLTTIRERFGQERTLVVDLHEAGPPLDIPGARVTRVEGPRQWLSFVRGEVTAAALVAEVARRATVVDIAVVETAIEDVVRRIYERGFSDDLPTSPASG